MGASEETACNTCNTTDTEDEVWIPCDVCDTMVKWADYDAHQRVCNPVDRMRRNHLHYNSVITEDMDHMPSFQPMADQLSAHITSLFTTLFRGGSNIPILHSDDSNVPENSHDASNVPLQDILERFGATSLQGALSNAATPLGAFSNATTSLQGAFSNAATPLEAFSNAEQPEDPDDTSEDRSPLYILPIPPSIYDDITNIIRSTLQHGGGGGGRAGRDDNEGEDDPPEDGNDEDWNIDVTRLFIPLDIENTNSYEINLMLQELMGGNVSVGLSNVEKVLKEPTTETVKTIDDDTECTICKTEIKELLEKEKTIVETSCKHLYCKECITEWLKHHKTCPVCMTILDDTASN